MNLTLFLAIVLGGLLLFVWVKLVAARRAEFIRHYALPDGLFDKLRKKRPELTLKECQLIAHALRQFFMTYLKSDFRYVSMPSQAADDLWHEFILYTRNYEQFCRRAFGRFLHHTPAVVLGSAQQNNEGLRRCWYFCCREENIDPHKPTRLPLLFALDKKLAIADGFIYEPDCIDPVVVARYGGVQVHCAGNLVSTRKKGGAGAGGCGAGCGGGGGGGHGCSGGCSGGCGGGGCGGS